MISETHIPVPAVTLLRDIIEKMRHDGCGGRAGKVELLTGIEGVSSRPVRRIVLRDEIASPVVDIDPPKHFGIRATTEPWSHTITSQANRLPVPADMRN